MSTEQGLSSPSLPGVTFVIPVHNGAAWLEGVLAAVFAQQYPGPLEVIAVDDRSSDGSPAILRRHTDSGRLRLLEGEGMGATAALNVGIRAARYGLIAQVDQDVLIEPRWLSALVAALADPQVAAAQGEYVVPRDAGIWARVMGLDLRERYARMKARLPRSRLASRAVALGGGGKAAPTSVVPAIVDTDHVCTGNSVYRATALHDIGLFDEAMGYGYDNDVSYRLTAKGYRLVFCPAATSVHRWREGLRGYIRQQYGFGYGRLDLVAKHRPRTRGDAVSPLLMMVHAPATLAALLLLGAAVLLSAAGIAASGWLAKAGIAVLVALGLERLTAGIAAAARFRDAAGLWFPLVHFVRDVAWAAAIGAWAARRAFGRPLRPSHSMKARSPQRNLVR